MTLLLDRNIEKGIHVLIVAVGHFHGRDFGDLEGAVLSGKRLAEWWRDSAGRCLPTKPLASVEVLISSKSPVSLTDGLGAEVAIEPALLENVTVRLNEWVGRSRDIDAVPIFHWIGHGEVLGQVNGMIHALFCEDVIPRGSRQRGIDWNATLMGLRFHLNAQPICYIDTCQVGSVDPSKFSLCNPFEFDVREGCPEPIVIYSTSVMGESYCVGKNKSVGRDFKGGALFSEAILLAQDRFGGRLSGSIAYAYPMEIFSAAERRLQRWNETVPFLREYNLKPIASIPARTKAFLVIPRPLAMVEFKITPEASDIFNNFSFGTAASHRPDRVSPQQWEYDMEYHKSWEVQVGLKKTKLSKERTIRHPPFDTYRPSHEETVDP